MALADGVPVRRPVDDRANPLGSATFFQATVDPDGDPVVASCTL